MHNTKSKNSDNLEESTMKAEQASGDLFDNYKKLTLPQNFGEIVGVKKVLTNVPVRRPDRQWWIRVHDDEDFRGQFSVLEMRDDRESYLVSPEVLPNLPPEIAGEVVPKQLLTSINRQGAVFLWSIRLPDENGKLDDWNQSAAKAAILARQEWVRVASSKGMGMYDVFEATGELEGPTWPDEDFPGLLRMAFQGRVIDDLSHPVIEKLQGAI